MADDLVLMQQDGDEFVVGCFPFGSAVHVADFELEGVLLAVGFECVAHLVAQAAVFAEHEGQGGLGHGGVGWGGNGGIMPDVVGFAWSSGGLWVVKAT